MPVPFQSVIVQSDVHLLAVNAPPVIERLNVELETLPCRRIGFRQWPGKIGDIANHVTVLGMRCAEAADSERDGHSRNQAVPGISCPVFPRWGQLEPSLPSLLFRVSPSLG